MCGFAGVLALRQPGTDPALAERMAASIRHRGPDDEGTYADEWLALGHRRLSVIDLSPGGHQPMSSADGSIWIAYNGELYNYRELDSELRALGYEYRSQSDTETIIHAYQAWGSACVHRFNGMFSFAIWDRRSRRLFCARDRFGEKPFYYTRQGDRLLFASEIKGLLQDPAVSRSVNYEVLARYLLENLTDIDGQTFFGGVSALLPGHTLIVENGHVYVESYWALPRIEDPAPDWTDEEWTQALRETLKDSVRLRLRSDVPVGTCLSGGLDSSSIVTLASQVGGGRPAAFSVVYDEEGFTEGRFIQAMGEQLPLDLHIVRPTGDDLFQTMEQLVWHNDEPSSSYGTYSQWQVMQLAASHGVTVILNGQGGDELLAGYHRYVPTYVRELLRTGHVWRAEQELRGSMARQDISIRQNLKQAIYPALPPALRAAYQRTVSDQPLAGQFLHPDFVSSVTAARRSTRPAAFGSLVEHLCHDLSVASVPALVHHEDRCSMAFSREIRLPFLDHRLVELMVRMPARMKIRRGVSKYALRQAMVPEGVPPEILARYDKKGYPTPMGKWFATTAREQTRDVLRSASFKARGVIDAVKAQHAFERHVRGERDHTQAIWQWVTLELWFRRFLDESTVGHHA